MENHNGSVVAKIVAFVVAENWSRPAKSVEFRTPKEAEKVGRGWFFVKLELTNGKVEYEPGIHIDCQVGQELYARTCTTCSKKTWVRKYIADKEKVLCLDCSDRAVMDNQQQEIQEEYDWWAEHRAECDGDCPICDPRAYPDED